LQDFQNVVIATAIEVPYQRRAPEISTTEMLVRAIAQALKHAGLAHGRVDGLGVSSFTLAPDHAIDVAFAAGLSPRWCMDDGHGGASGINLLQHAARAIQAGDADTILLVSGDVFTPVDFVRLVENYNVTTRTHLRPLDIGSPNAVFAMLTQRQMLTHDLERSDYAALCIAQRAWAALNPLAVYRQPLTLEAYLAAPCVATPLGRFDCVPVVSGANALLVTRADLAPPGHPTVGVRALRSSFNFDHQVGDGLQTGLHLLSADLWNDAGIGPADIDLVSVYDDYPAMILAQLADLGFAPDGNLKKLIHDRITSGVLPVNTSGGQLSAGQAGAAGGMHGLVEAVIQLQRAAGQRQVAEARLAVVSGYGMVEYRYGMCANAVVLEGSAQ
jgi:acetyl-CoA acetyltransferase